MATLCAFYIYLLDGVDNFKHNYVRSGLSRELTPWSGGFEGCFSSIGHAMTSLDA